jgi:hypothetical protein
MSDVLLHLVKFFGPVLRNFGAISPIADPSVLKYQGNDVALKLFAVAA